VAAPAAGIQGAAPAASAVLLAGRLPLTPELARRWGWAGSWRHPVGDPLDHTRPDPDGAPGFRINRGVGGATGRGRHRGADLDNGRGGDLVRAAAHGLVVVAETRGWHGGFGLHVVIAHRLRDGALAYSVYAHLAEGSVKVARGDLVWAGEPIGRVGDTGRASTRHLHFEIRLPDDPAARWERARVVDPVNFVAARLPAPRRDDATLEPYVAWAEAAALVAAGAPADLPLSRAAWWTMLAHAAAHSLENLPAEPARLRDVLVGEGLLPEDAGGDPAAPATWTEIARDVARAEAFGVRLPPPPLDDDAHRARCRETFGAAQPAMQAARLGRHTGTALVGEACLLLADLARAARRP